MPKACGSVCDGGPASRRLYKGYAWTNLKIGPFLVLTFTLFMLYYKHIQTRSDKMTKKIDYSGLYEIYPMDLGSFMLYTQEGYWLSMKEVEKVFSEPQWKTYYIDGKGRFVVADNRTGKAMELKIKQFEVA
jgi:hypothetical protein